MPELKIAHKFTESEGQNSDCKVASVHLFYYLLYCLPSIHTPAFYLTYSQTAFLNCNPNTKRTKLLIMTTTNSKIMDPISKI